MPRNLLIVDDLSINRKILRGMLSEDYTVLEAASGAEALDVLSRGPASVSAVLLDISMPGMDGFEVLRRIRSNALLARLPVVMITSSEDEETRVKSLALGANDFVMKPYSSEVIKHCLRNNIAFAEAAATLTAMQRDKLTGLYNREAFFEKTRELVFAHAPGYYVMACFDIDRFKVINDQYGTQKGDEVLIHIADAFKEGFRPQGGICCRVFADNFAVLYPASFQDSDEIRAIRTRASHIEGLVLPVIFRIGRYVVDDVSMLPSAMYDRAALAANSVKGRYDANIATYDEAMRNRLLSEQSIVLEMEDALKARQFEVWFQPQYNHSTGAMIGAEALVRWRHPVKGLIPPGAFIPLFEQNGFIYSLDRFVWEEVCRTLRKWLDAGRSPLPVSVNLSRYDVFRPDVIETISGLIERYELPIDLLRLEITESAFSESTQHIVDVVKELIARGFTVEIDDFGSGYSSLNTLKDVPAQILKLDMKFLHSSSDSSRGGNIVESVVRMAKWLGMSVIAEGVETLEQANYLRSIGCNYMQGYLYAVPMPVQDYEAYCSGSDKEERLLTLETVENLDNNAFWDPNSMDTLIFNSYVGGACIYEYHQGKIELLRATQKYAQVIGSAGMTVEDALKLDWAEHLDAENSARVITDLEESIQTRNEVTGEYVFLDLPNCPHETYLRSTMRVIASAGNRYLVYCTNDNITAQRQSEKREKETADRLSAIMKNMNGGVAATVIENDGIRQLFANERYYEQLGYAKADYEAQFTGAPSRILPEDREMVMERCKAISATGRPDTIEFRVRRADGAIRWLRSNITLMDYPGETEPVQLAVSYDITERLEAQQKIRRLSEQLQAIMDNIDLGIIAATVENGEARYQFANNRYYELLGYTKTQFEAEVHSPHLTVAPEDRQRVMEETARINRIGASTIIIYAALTRDGRKRSFRAYISTASLSGVDAPVQFSIVRDITEELSIERRERAAAERLQAIMRDVDCGITAAVLDDDGKIETLFTNERFYELHGYTRAQYEAEITDKYACIHPDDREQARLDTIRAYTTRTPAQLEYRLVWRDGSVHYVRVNLSSTRFTGVEQNVHLCIFTDITAEKLSEQTASDAAAQIQNMMDDMPGGFVRMRVDASGSIRPVYVNDGFVKLTGMRREQIMELYADDALTGVHPDDVSIVKDVIAKMLQEGEAHSARYRLMNGKGGYTWLSVFGRATKDASGDAYLNVYYSDASEQMKEEETQRALLDNLPGGAGIYEFQDGQISLAYQNKSYWELVGLQSAAFPDPAPMSAVYPDDIPIIMQELASAIEQHRDVVCDIRMRHLTLGYRSVHLVGRVVHKETGGFLIYATFTPNDNKSMSYQHMLPVVLSAIMESTSDLSFAKDINFRYLTASRAFANLVGQTSEDDVIGKTDYDLFDREMADKYRRDDEALLESGKSIVDMVEVIPSESGTPRYSSTSKYILRDGSGAIIGLYGVGRDVTRAFALDRQLRLVNDSVPGGLATYAYSGGSLRIVYCNDGFCKLFGGSREGFMQRGDFDPIDWVFAEDRPELLAQIDALVRDDQPMDCVFRIHVIGGGYKWINEKAIAVERHGESVQFSAVLLDITQRQNALEQLRISEEENTLAVQLGGNIACRYLIADKTLTLSPEVAAANSLPEKISDVPYEPVRLGMISAESVDAYVGFFESILHGSKAATAIFQQKYFGAWRWMEAKSSTIFSDDGTPVKAVISFYDITERLERETIYKKWQHSLTDRPAETYSLFKCNLSNDTAYATTEGTLLSFNFDAAGCDFNERARTYAAQRVFEDDRDRYLAFANSDTMLASYYRGKRSDILEYREQPTGEAPRWLRLTVDLVESPNSTEVEAYLMYEDIDEAKQAELKTKALSETDPLTGLLNRTTFAAQVEQILRHSKPETRHALLMLDIDGFKQVNDVFGHGAGDQTLVDLAGAMRAIMRRDDLVSRLGGDEFTVFLCNISDDHAAAAKAKQICALARKSFSLEVQISASIGIALAPHDGVDFQTLYKKADSALYHVKGSGKDSHAFYNDGMSDEHLEPEADTVDPLDMKVAQKRRRMLIVDDNVIDNALLQNIFSDLFIIEKAKDGASALIRLRHYGSAISVVLLDLMMPGMDGFSVLEKMQGSADLSSIPVIIVSGDESRETCLEAIRKGATDFITKPVDAELLRIRVCSAVSRAENERLRAKNRLLEVQSEERLRYEAVLDSTGVTFIEYNWLTGAFGYDPSISHYLAGTFDSRKLWQILLSDRAADTQTVQMMQQLVHRIAEDRLSMGGTLLVELKTPQNITHRFRMTVRKLVNEYQLTNQLMIVLTDLDYELA